MQYYLVGNYFPTYLTKINCRIKTVHISRKDLFGILMMIRKADCVKNHEEVCTIFSGLFPETNHLLSFSSS